MQVNPLRGPPGRSPARRRLVSRLLLLLIASGIPSTLRAQVPAVEAENPRVERVTFIGVEELREAELREAIVTEPTRCRGLVLRPICAIIDSPLLFQRHFLDRAELRLDEFRLRVHYFRRGYRRARIASEVRPRGAGVEVIFTVEEGPPTLLDAVAVEQTRPVLTDRQIRRAALPAAGKPLDLYALSAGLERLGGRLGELGHLDAALHDTAAFSPDSLRASLAVTIDPGPRSTLADFDIDGNEDVDDRTIRDALRLQQGRVLRTRDIVASQRSLYESNLFHEARVEVPAQPDSAKRVEITVREAPPRAGRVGGGFNTIEYLQAEARYTHYNWMGRGRRLDIRGTVGNLLADQLRGQFIFRDVLPRGSTVQDVAPYLRPTWLASAELMQPAFRSASNVIGLNVFTHRRIVPGVAVDEGFGAEVSATRRLDYRAPATIAYRHELASVRAGDVYFCVNYGICDVVTIEVLRGRHTLSPFALNFFADQANNPLAPTEGYRLRLDVEHASGVTLSDFRYNRVSTESSLYLPLDLHRRRVLAGRARAGWVQPLAGTLRAFDLNGDGALEPFLHPRKRFYSGGSRSVRGFRENQLGPRILAVDPMELMEADEACTPGLLAAGACDPAALPLEALLPRPTGGMAVVEGSVEYRFPVRWGVTGAVFIDGALVSERPRGLFSDGVHAVAPGFGARVPTPIGPIRVDLGIRPRLIQNLPVVTEYVGEDGVRRLVRLEESFRYDPVGDGAGFLRHVLNRLTLHLAIGEAY
jgi:outer membrane protein insertion porin family